MKNEYTAVLKQEGDWWVGWIEEVPGVNCQERTYETLKETLSVTLKEALEFNRLEALRAGGIFFRRPSKFERRNLKMTTDLHTLPIVERIKLVEDIWDSIAVDQAALPLTDEQKTELNRRLDAYESDQIKGREAKEVIADIRKRL